MFDHVVIITGGAEGIGRACALLFLGKGYNVISFDIAHSEDDIKYLENHNINDDDNNVDCENFEDFINPSPHIHMYCIKCDVSDMKDLTEKFNLVIKKFGRIDCIVNNAGVHAPVTPTIDFTTEDVEKNFRINYMSNYKLCQLAIPYLKKSKGATIIFVTSMVALIGQGNAAAYCSSKAAQIGLMKSLAIELAPDVRVNAVAPSNVFTSCMEKWLNTFDDPKEMKTKIENVQKLKRMANPSEIAEIIYFLASHKSSFITGQVIQADGGAQLDYY